MARARRGDRRAFEILLRAHDREMRGVAWRLLGDRTALDDALQDGYLNAYRSIGQLRGDDDFAGWLHRIVTNACLDLLRQRSRRPEDPIDWGPEPAVGSDEDRITDADQILAALRLLSPDQRAVLVLVEAEGYSYDEVAAMLGITAGTVGSRLSRARTRLRRRGVLR